MVAAVSHGVRAVGVLGIGQMGRRTVRLGLGTTRISLVSQSPSPFAGQVSNNRSSSCETRF